MKLKMGSAGILPAVFGVPPDTASQTAWRDASQGRAGGPRSPEFPGKCSRAIPTNSR